MFLRKLTVMVVPLLLCVALCLLLPLLNGMGFMAWVLGGALLGILLALLLPLSGATRMREPFGQLLWVPSLLLALVMLYQYLHGAGLANLPLLAVLATNYGNVVFVEAALVGFMLTTVIRTR